jgi:hypothetical protein
VKIMQYLVIAVVLVFGWSTIAQAEFSFKETQNYKSCSGWFDHGDGFSTSVYANDDRVVNNRGTRANHNWCEYRYDCRTGLCNYVGGACQNLARLRFRQSTCSFESGDVTFNYTSNEDGKGTHDYLSANKSPRGYLYKDASKGWYTNGTAVYFNGTETLVGNGSQQKGSSVHIEKGP